MSPEMSENVRHYKMLQVTFYLVLLLLFLKGNYNYFFVLHFKK